MQTLRYVRRRPGKPLFSSTTSTITCSTATSSSTTTSTTNTPLPVTATALQNFSTGASNSTPSSIALSETSNDIVSSFREWFSSRKNPFLEQIFEILRGAAADDAAADTKLQHLNLRLTEALVLEVLNYQKPRQDVLSCWIFFDWAGHQPGFHHTRATFHAIFRILSKAKLGSIMLEYFIKQRYIHKVSFDNTLVIGYSVAGRPETALVLLGKMRFKRVDLDPFGYNVLLNALVEEGHFDAVETVAEQIKVRGHETAITHSIRVKGYCKQSKLDRAEEYLRGLVGEEKSGMNGTAIGILVDALCKEKRFEKAGMLVEDFRKLNVGSMDYAYGVWIRNLIKAGKLNGALEFLKDKSSLYGYVPDVFCYNTLVCRLLRENQLKEVIDLFIEMMEHDILPDEVTMNATLCFFYKAGMFDSAVELYNSGKEFGFSINGKKTLNIIAKALCREQKLDKMKELLLVSFYRDLMLKGSTYSKFISALCKARRVEDAYLVHEHLSRLNKVATAETYFNLISGFKKESRGDIAARLLIEMQEKGHPANRKLFRSVICCLCEMNNPEEQFSRLLCMQFSQFKPSSIICNYFIDGAGHAKKPELARKVYEMMGENGVTRTLKSDILLLQSFLKSEKISDALNFFKGMSRERKAAKRIWHVMIVGLAKGKRLDYALEIFWEMRTYQMKPSLECYEELVKLLCAKKEYVLALGLIEDLTQTGRRVSPFIGNVLLLNCLYTRKLFTAWNQSREMQNVTLSSWTLHKLIGLFSGCLEASQDIEHMEELIRQCFVPDIFTQNVLLRRLIMTNGIDYAAEYLNKLPEKGYEPNRWTYEALVLGYLKAGRDWGARKFMEIMKEKGYDLSEATKKYIDGISGR